MLTKLLIALTCVLHAAHEHHHECIHGQIASQVGLLPENNPNAFLPHSSAPHDPARFLEEITWRKIKIVFDTSLAKGASAELKTYIFNTALPILESTLGSFTYVRGSQTISKFSNTACDKEFQVPASYANQTVAGDLLIFVDMVDENTNFAAYAMTCMYEPVYRRPVVGLIKVNTKKITISAPGLKKLNAVLLHEALHILVISPSSYSLYYGNKNAIQQETVSTSSGTKIAFKLVSPTVLAAAKEHFNCYSITGVYLEDEGSSVSAGTHFEKVKFGHELMTSKLTGFPSMSKITLALMEDSGWYQIDYDKAQHLSYGYKQGCNFLIKSCNTSYQEFCTNEDEMGCSRDFMGKTLCKSSDYTNNCNLANFIDKYVCTNVYNFTKTTDYEESGPQSRCFVVKNSDKKSVGCFKSSCDGRKLTIHFKDKSIECLSSGAVVEYKGVKITCPDIITFCDSFNSSCFNDCSSHGTCLLNQTCRCDYFFSGSNCSLAKGCDENQELICAALVPGSAPTFHMAALIAFLVSFLV